MNRTAIGVTGMICGTALLAAHWTATAGPLDPPAEAVDGSGAPVSTQPSLAELREAVIGLESQVGSSSTFELFWSRTTSQTTSLEIASGRVLIHSISVSLLPDTDNGGTEELVVFDGPGTVNGSGSVTSGTALLSLDRTIAGRGGVQSGSWRSSSGMDTVVLDVVVENGLHIAWSGARSVIVTYRPLD